MGAIKRAIPPELLGQELSGLLMKWYETEEGKFFLAIDEAAEAMNEAAQSRAPISHRRRAGTYRAASRLGSERPTKHSYRRTWYVEEPEYRLTHLLEYGHLTRNGTSRTRPRPHIKYGRQIAEEVLDERLASLWGS